MKRVTPVIGHRTPIFLVLSYNAAPGMALSEFVHITILVSSALGEGDVSYGG